MSPALFSAKGLTVRYGRTAKPALEDVTLALAPGERLAVIGESGSGKSTLARALAGLLPPGGHQSGTVEWPSLGRAPLPGRDHGFVFQEPGASLDPVMRIGGQLTETLRATLGLNPCEAQTEALDLLARMRLPDPPRLLRAFPHELSGGQKQRVGIALAIAGRPALLIADEPTSALDTIVQADVMALMAQLVAEEGMALLLVTHDLALASTMADRIAVLKDGALVEWGDAGAVINRPSHPYTESLLRSYLALEPARP